VYGALFSRLNFLWSEHVRQETWIKRHPILEVALVSIDPRLQFIILTLRSGHSTNDRGLILQSVLPDGRDRTRLKRELTVMRPS